MTNHTFNSYRSNVKDAIRNFFFIHPQAYSYITILLSIQLIAEFGALFVARTVIMDTNPVWMMIALPLVLARGVMIVYFLLQKDVLYFVIPQLISTFVWSSYGFMNIGLGFEQDILVITILTAVAAATSVFIVWIKNAYYFFVIMLITPSAILVIVEYPEHFYVGVGLIILMIYLLMMSHDLSNLLKTTLDQNQSNMMLIDDEKNKKQLLNQLVQQINDDMNQRKHIEKLIIDTNDKIEQSISSQINTKKTQEHNFSTILNHMRDGFLLYDVKTKNIRINQVLCSLFDIHNQQRHPHLKQLHQRHGHLFAVCYIDLDDFKIINDTLGHEAGNYVLKVISQRLMDMIGQEHFICRMGGDEFLAIIGQLSYKSDCDIYIKRMIDAFKTPIYIQEIPYFLSASIGVSFYPCDAREQSALITNADCAMYESKTKGKNTFAYYQPYQSKHMQSKLTLQQMIRKGIKSHEFYFEFQPILSLNQPNTLKFEALSRWSQGISPGIYIPMAEEMNIIHELCMQHLHKSIEYVGFIKKYCSQKIEISINISSKQINNPKHREELIAFIKNWPHELCAIELEITETSLVNLECAETFIQAAHQCGATIALDDFGTGFSGFKQIQELAFDNIKIDRSFTNALACETNGESAELLEKLIKIITKIGAQITVEGVETESQLNICHELGSHYLQGYFISKPISLKELIEYSASHS